MKILRTVIRVLMMLATLAVAALAIVFGIFQSSSTGFFSAPHSPEERMRGVVMLIAGATMVLFSFLLLKRKNFVPFGVCLGALFVAVLGMGRLNQEGVLVVFPYVQGMILAFGIDLLIGKKFPEVENADTRQRDKKLNKLLIGIPITFLLLGGLYVTYGQYWIEEVKDSNYQRVKLTSLGYQLFNAKYIPTGYSLRETRMGGVRSNYFYAEYRNSAQKYFMLAQFLKPKSLSLSPPMCQIYGSGSDSFEIQDIYGNSSGINSACEEIVTPKGRKIYLMSYEIVKEENFAAVIIDKTLITVAGYSFSQEELIRMIDSLEASNPAIKSPNQKYY